MDDIMRDVSYSSQEVSADDEWNYLVGVGLCLLCCIMGCCPCLYFGIEPFTIVFTPSWAELSAELGMPAWRCLGCIEWWIWRGFLLLLGITMFISLIYFFVIKPIKRTWKIVKEKEYYSRGWLIWAGILGILALEEWRWIIVYDILDIEWEGANSLEVSVGWGFFYSLFAILVASCLHHIVRVISSAIFWGNQYFQRNEYRRLKAMNNRDILKGEYFKRIESEYLKRR